MRTFLRLSLRVRHAPNQARVFFLRVEWRVDRGATTTGWYIAKQLDIAIAKGTPSRDILMKGASAGQNKGGVSGAEQAVPAKLKGARP